MTPSAFLKEIKTNRKAFYILSGGEPTGIDRCLKAAEEIIASGFVDFNLQVLDLEAGEAGRLIAEASTMPFFAPPRVLILKNPPFTATDWALLADYLENPNKDSLIIMVLEKPDGRLKFFKKLKADDAEVDCSVPKGAALNKWLQDELAAKGVKADIKTCALIIERSGDDPRLLMGEAEKISLYLGEGGKLSEIDVRKLVSIAPNADIFQLGEALGRRDAQNAISTLMDLLATEHHLPVLAMMVRHFRLMLQIKSRQAELGVKYLEQTEARNLGMHPFVLKKTQGQASAWSWRELTEALKDLEDAHRSLVTSPVPPLMVLENLALKLARNI